MKGQVKGTILGLLFISVFVTVFALYSLPLEPILYSALLCLYISLIFWTIDFLSYRKRYKTLQRLQKTITVHIDELPQPRETIENLYQELITILHHDKNQLALQADSKQSELVDYFTQWTHQIKTPIAAMSLLLQSKDQNKNQELSLQLFKIEQYVEFVLQYLRLDSMSSDLVFKQYNLDDIVRQAVRKHAKMFIGKKISLQYTDLTCRVLTDEKWLLFVIEQLLSNALKYTNEGTISIYMDPNQDKMLVIEDNGIGIRAEDLPRVFEKGFTGYNGRAFKKSTGIGLYLCKRILSKLSHTIIIESEVGKGTIVRINLTTKRIEMD